MRFVRFARAALVTIALVAAMAAALASPAAAQPLPTVVLVHGAFADTTSWDPVAAELRGRGYTVVAPDNPLRGPGYDAATVEKTLAEISGPVVLVGHSYGGAVITNTDNPNVKALVYIAAFAPAQGEPVQLGLDPIRFPGSQLLPPVLQVKVVDDPQAIGGRNLDGYIAADAFHRVFAPDVSDATAATMLAHQRSIAVWANLEPSGPTSWSNTPSWALIPTGDNIIPPASQRFMAGRIGAHTTEIAASHAVLVSQPIAVADVIAAAAGS
ncbi:Pimeloyl-ACP methyl ester carboxylesterase [Nocardia amikacinitolerans]|uniref:Pimeloyl-ACP methyl ester carboxylesterase n=1 Tax=Nocardia amikacinitolerans TaxID=756689 RepID=A0A285KZ08_9NOCA|nr:alpha/beta hydrolase [Nocardia amikacinitolerans]SNY77892.1 Pimeloyl-ACP methyl ester carboxylesterase [Nocardia amikacinitolerans]